MEAEERRRTGDREAFRRVWEAQAVGPPQIERNLLGERGDLRRVRREMSFLDFRDVDRDRKVVEFLPRTPTTSPILLFGVRRVLPVISFNSPHSASGLPNRRPSSAFDLRLTHYPHHRVPHLFPRTLVLSDLLLPNLALWTSAYYPVFFQGLARSRAIVSTSAKVSYLLGVL